MNEKTISIVGVIATIIIGWDEISVFIQSFFQGFSEFLKSIPSLILLGIVIFIIYSLGHRK